MKLKTYYGKTQQEAMNLAKEELGQDVIMLETREIGKDNSYDGKQNFVQITVAADREPNGFQLNHQKSKPPQDNFVNRKPFGEYYSSVTQESEQRSEPNTGIAEELTFLRHELNRLNHQLRKLTTPEFPEPYSKVFEQLLRTGISEDLAARFVRRAFLLMDGKNDISKDKVFDTVKYEICALFNKEVPSEKASKGQPRVIAVVGPTGVGKTTAIMKLAVHPEFYGQKKIAIISTDSYRVASAEPLKTFSKIASIPVIGVSSSDDLIQQIEKLANYEVILIDTPGRSPYFPNYIQELQNYFSIIDSPEVLLVLSTTADMEDLFLTTGMYLTLNPTGIIFTKVDETSRPGKIISMMVEVGLPAVFFSDGQMIPNNLREGKGEFIWEKFQEIW